MNLTTRLKNILHTHPEKKILGYKKNNQWNWVTREELRNKICYCIDLLNYSGLSKNDRVMFKGNNSVNWVAWNAGASAVLAASIFHYGTYSVAEAKQYLASKDIPVRI